MGNPSLVLGASQFCKNREFCPEPRMSLPLTSSQLTINRHAIVFWLITKLQCTPSLSLSKDSIHPFYLIQKPK